MLFSQRWLPLLVLYILQPLNNVEDPLLPLSSSFMNLSLLHLSNTVKVYANCLNKFWSDMPDHTDIRNTCVNIRKSLTYNHKVSHTPQIPFYSKNKTILSKMPSLSPALDSGLII